MAPLIPEPAISVSEFVALVNQAFDYTFPTVTIVGELANLRVSKGKWLYFDLKDQTASVKFFGTIYQLPGPLENGIIVSVQGMPRLHNQYGFSVTVHTIQPFGEGSIRRAAELLKTQLEQEGLFDVTRKRPLPYPPLRIGLITSKQSAAYKDFLKVLTARWRGITIELIDVQVQGEIAPRQIMQAIEDFNSLAEPPEALVIIRGGGSAEDLAAFSSEGVTRAVAASRIPTLVAIGHEIDICLAELAADQRASTPSNAAELLVPDRRHTRVLLQEYRQQLEHSGRSSVQRARQELNMTTKNLEEELGRYLDARQSRLHTQAQLLAAFNPSAILKRGYAIVRQHQQSIRFGNQVERGAIVQIELIDSHLKARIMSVIAKTMEKKT